MYSKAFFSVFAMISPANISSSCIIYIKSIQNTGITEITRGLRCENLFVYSRGPKTLGANSLLRLSLRRVRLASVGPQYGACLTSPFWRLGMRDVFWIFKNLCTPLFIVYFTMMSVYRTTQGTSSCKETNYELEKFRMMKLWHVSTLECEDWQPRKSHSGYRLSRLGFEQISSRIQS